MTTLKELILELIALLKQYLSKPEEKSVVLPEPQIKAFEPFRNKNVLIVAAQELGQTEVPGTKDNPRIKEYHKYSTIKNALGMADSVPWCASFVCWCLEKAGMQSTNSKLARSFERWGISSKIAPLPGDIVVFWRKSPKSGYGHVGILLKKSGSRLWVLGGNQSDSVNVATFTTDKMTDIRRSSKAKPYSPQQIEELHTIADKIISGESVFEVGTLT